ncbi:hypothetical protein E4U52_007722 [Claviceps spartinae]|nr:hypothetical protein E4U52_007722 [Claviceps spartinae]
MSSLPPDPYKILGVSKDAQIPEIRSAHRKLVLKCHPDKVHDPSLKAQKQAEFQQVQSAYELLSDESERQKYDESVMLEELQRQFDAKIHVSMPRSSARYSGQDEFRGAGSRASPFKASTTSSGVRFTFTTQSSEDGMGRGAHTFEASPRPSRRESSYADKSSKREMEKERERERAREREREREKGREKERERERERQREREREREAKEKARERRRREEEAARRREKEAKEAKEARRAEKKAREKQRDKEMKREAEEKKRRATSYAEAYAYGDDMSTPKSDKKKSSSSKKHDEKRERSSGRDDLPPMPSSDTKRSYAYKVNYAKTYIQAAKAKGAERSSATSAPPMWPPAPTPPPIIGSSSDSDEAPCRTSGKAHRSSGEVPRVSRERSYRAPSHEAPPVPNASSSSRHAAQYAKASPSRADLPRTKTMPSPEPTSYSRPPPGLSRAQTFNVFEHSPEYPRGRDRSRMQPQAGVESDGEEAYGRRRDRKHRSSKHQQTPEQLRTENVSRYQVDGARSRLHSSYVRHVEPDYFEGTHTYYAHPQDVRPPMPGREASYSAAGATAKFPKVKTSKSYGYDDVRYTHYDVPHREEYAYA